MAAKKPKTLPSSSSSPSPSSEARRLKSLAELKLASASLKAALKYARRARRLSPNLDGVSALITAIKILRCSPSDHYKTLRLDPFSPPSLVKKQYKTLALTLHPDKSEIPSPAADEAFKRVADSYRFLTDRENKKRFDDELRIRIAGEFSADRPAETFWTACDRCQTLHEFDQRYVGQRLVCPSCHKSFIAAEVSDGANLRARGARSNVSIKKRKVGASWSSRPKKAEKEKTLAEMMETVEPKKPGKGKTSAKMMGIGASPSPEPKKPKKEKTLAEMLEIEKAKAKKEKENNQKAIVSAEKDDLSLMAVEDSDFYDFDKDRTEKSFVRGQVWAIYDDDDGMPRHYGLIEDVASLGRFKVKMSWLDAQNSGDESLVLWEKSGHHISSGRFKVGRKVDIDSVNCFSHLVEFERAAKEVYRIYPKKGSVWALYGEGSLGGEEKRCYDIVVCLTSYSEMYGLSMAHLEKVEGYKTIFKRREIGAHAIMWLEKDDARLFSHQIPARKLSDMDDENLPRECWELDPASLPAELLRLKLRRKLHLI